MLGIADLDEGPRCMARIEGGFGGHTPDERVDLVARDSGPVPLFAFRRFPGTSG